MALKWTFGLVLVAAVVGGVAVWVIELLRPFTIYGAERLMTMAGFVAGFCVAGLGCAAALHRGRARGWMLSGMIAAAVGAVGWGAVMWGALSVRPEVWFMRFFLVMPPTCWAGLMMVTGWLLLPRLRSGRMRWIRGMTLAAAALLAAEICIALCVSPFVARSFGPAEVERLNLFVFRSGAILLILTVLGLVTVYGVARLPELLGQAGEPVGEYTMTVTCPRCGSVAKLRSGGDACPKCGLKIKVTAA